ncbi:hypothetical protein GDO78_014463 [Eleutherodactylus coqui]|uniref:Uncharacterized protein n=1 Tax=Eleutherodactylus coqui TaxID=57060 RepID=A0A8J6JXE4_ELECQ|nr:hypothetical protein GDO78_014463 [Eleutherodactylus coqui]
MMIILRQPLNDATQRRNITMEDKAPMIHIAHGPRQFLVYIWPLIVHECDSKQVYRSYASWRTCEVIDSDTVTWKCYLVMYMLCFLGGVF